MPFIVVYDACVLYPAPLRDLLVRLGLSGLCQVKWTRRILDECFSSLLRERTDLVPEKLVRTRELLERSIPDVEVTGYEELVEGIIGLPDPNDRHVVAAAVRSGAQVIVTRNLKDFPGSVLGRYGVEAQSPDDFVRDLIDLNEEAVVQVIRKQAAALKNSRTMAEVLGTLRKQSLIETCALLETALSRRGFSP